MHINLTNGAISCSLFETYYVKLQWQPYLVPNYFTQCVVEYFTINFHSDLILKSYKARAKTQNCREYLLFRTLNPFFR